MIAGAWALEAIDWTDGTVGSLTVRATRKCGRVEDLIVSLWPAGWRFMQLHHNLPKSVVAATLRLAKDTGL